MLLKGIHTAFAIDLGTNNTLVYCPKKGIVIDEPTLIAYDSTRRVFCHSGVSSHKMVGKSPRHMEVMYPLSKGAIANLDVAKAYIKDLIHRIAPQRWSKPTILVSVPSDLNGMERNAVIEAGKEGGAREVLLVKDPISALLGAHTDLHTPIGSLVLDIGAGVSEVSLLSCNGIVMSQSLRMGGNDMDEAIVEYFKNTKRILLSLHDAEQIKKEMGDLYSTEAKQMRISVKNLINRMPEIHEINAHDVKQAVMPLVEKFVNLTHAMISVMPPVFAEDIYDRGIILTGGTSLLTGLDHYLSERLGVTCKVVENPLHNIILGAGKIIENGYYAPLLSA